MALHHSFPSLLAALLLDTCLSNCHACTPALVLTWCEQEAEVSLSGIRMLFDPAPPAGKAAISPSCLSFECFDILTKSCIKCSDLFKDNTTEPTLATTLTSTFLIVGVPVVVGFILVLATLCGFLACKVGKWRRKRKAADEEDKENIDIATPLPSPDPAMPEGDGALNPAPFLHLDGSLKMPGPPRKARTKQRPFCQGSADGDIVLFSTVYPRPQECNHSFPLPATELGATALVTTKTTQNCAREERV